MLSEHVLLLAETPSQSAYPDERLARLVRSGDKLGSSLERSRLLSQTLGRDRA